MSTRCPALLLACLLALGALAACGGEDVAGPEVHTADNGEEYVDADASFASSMLQHHAQALAMVDLTLGRGLDPAVQELVEEVRTEQSGEIQTLTGWLTDWGKPVPETVRDHANAHGDGSASHDGPVSQDDMHELERAWGAEFQALWLELMTEHHEEAVEIAEDEQTEGLFGPAVDLAESIERTQSEQIDRMAELQR